MAMKRGIAIPAFTVVLVLASSWGMADGYRTSVGNADDAIAVVVVKGTPYEMGYAVGELMKEEILDCMNGFLGLARASGEAGSSNEALDAAWGAIAPYTDDRFKEELRGLADGSGMPLEELRRAHMIPVASDYSCSGVAVWGKATKDGDLYQIRNLDYTMEAGLQNHPTIVIYLPDNGIPHANVTFAGYIGSNTGINAEGIVLSEKGASPKSDRPFDLNGAHFSTYFRDVLYDAHSLDEAIRIITQAKRIKKYRFYVGDGKNKKAVKMKAYAPDLTVWADNDPGDEVAPNVLEAAIYYTMDDDVTFAHLTTYYGRHDARSMIELSKKVATRNGNLLNVVYDASKLEFWVAYAQGPMGASTRPYIHVNLKDYLTYDPTGSVAQSVGADRGGSSRARNLAILGVPVALIAGVLGFRLKGSRA